MCSTTVLPQLPLCRFRDISELNFTIVDFPASVGSHLMKDLSLNMDPFLSFLVIVLPQKQTNKQTNQQTNKLVPTEVLILFFHFCSFVNLRLRVAAAAVAAAVAAKVAASVVAFAAVIAVATAVVLAVQLCSC